MAVIGFIFQNDMHYYLKVIESRAISVIDYFQFQKQKYAFHREFKVRGADKEILGENEKQKVW